MHRDASPLVGNTIDWRAGYGRSARPVRREGGSNPIGSPHARKPGPRPFAGVTRDKGGGRDNYRACQVLSATVSPMTAAMSAICRHHLSGVPAGGIKA